MFTETPPRSCIKPKALAQAPAVPRPLAAQTAVSAPKVATSPTVHASPDPTIPPAQPSQEPMPSSSLAFFHEIPPPPHGVEI